MNLLAPVSSIMSTDLVTVNPEDKLEMVKEIFDKRNIHHIPVVRFKKIVGLISKSDFLHFLRGTSENPEDRFINQARLRAFRAKDIMTEGLAKIESTERINVAIELFKVNRFHAIPVVDKDELIGIITTFDIIDALSKESTSTPS